MQKLRPLILAFSLCFAFWHAEAALAQAEGEWRALLPDNATGDRPETSDNGTPDAAPLEIGTRSGVISATGEEPAIRLGSVLVDADRKIDHAIFDAAIEPHLGKLVSQEELSKLAQEIADVARANGMILASAHIPEQKVELGILRIVLEVGVIDEVRIEGSDNRALRRLFAPLAGETVLKGDIERKLMLARDIPGVNIRQTQLVSEDGRQILLVKVEDRKKLRGRLAVDNFGSDFVGPLRARLSVEAVSLLDDSDYANVTFRANPADPRELVAASMTYGVGLDANGTKVELSGAWSNSEFGRSNVAGWTGRSGYASVSISHPLRRSRTSNLWIDGQLEYLTVDQQAFGAILQSDTVVTLSTGLSASFRTASGWLRAGTQLRQGLGILGATGAYDPLASRFNADGRFTSARMWASWSADVAKDVTVRVAVNGQMASEPLLSSEEMGLGGSFSGRAFNFYERSGDRGVQGYAEIGYAISNPARWLKRLQPYVFVDGGCVDELGIGWGGGSLASAGGGIRGVLGPIDVQLETAIPLISSGQWSSSGDPRVNFQLGVDF